MSKTKRKSKPKTIGELSQSRGTWGAIKPVTKVIPDKKKYSRKEKYKGVGY